jgi:hypothetical protein
VSHKQVVECAALVVKQPSVTYRRARFGKEGILHPGESVVITDGTIFSVADTSSA